MSQKEILDFIDITVNEFLDGLSPIQERQFRNLSPLLKELKTNPDGSIKNSLENLRQVRRIKKELDAVIMDAPYLKKVAGLMKAYKKLADLQNNYFAQLTTEFTPKKVFEEVMKLNIDLTVDRLTENGIGAAYTSTIMDILKTNISTGGRYAEFIEQVRATIIGNDEIDGTLLRYAKNTVTDSINQYNASYTATITNDLGLVWYQYTGSLREKSRDFCIAMIKKKWFHISEVEQMLSGQIGVDSVPINPKTGLPYGFIAGTNAATFFVNRGGYGCAHQLFPTITSAVPKEVRESLK